MTPEEFEARLGFPLDHFQRRAMRSLQAGRSVLVAAPTGAGKTAVAEYAIALAHGGGGKAFYTTPLKALSNQKFGDFVKSYGVHRVGLLTGDISINGEAPIVVMTTEVLRNMIYEDSPTLAGLRFVVLDEVHYLQNPYRGGVWEEVIVHVAPEVALVCLSATVSNVEEFGEWLTTVRGATDVVIEERRPVTLENLYLWTDRRSRRIRSLPLTVRGRPNPEGEAIDHRGHPQRRGRVATPRRVEVVDYLEDSGMVPAIYFIFSRDGCDRAATACLEAGVRLAGPDERIFIREIAESKVESLTDRDLEVLGYTHWLACLEAGVAAHHAGLVPPFKETVETCFAAGAVKVVFATETLSLGINMPARCVVIERLSKFSGECHERLTPGEYTQLTGRAGRRGLDERGYGIVLWSPVETFASIVSLASTRSYELRSSFRPTYNMAANLVRTTTREDAHQLLNLSFAQFRADAEVVRLEAEMRGAPAARRKSMARRIDAHSNALSRTFEVVLALLEGRGYVSGWSLTPAGERLGRIYHESDLLVAGAVDSGVLDGLTPPELAAVVSMLTYEERSAGRGDGRGTTRGPAVSGKVEAVIADRLAALQSAALELNRAEDAAGLPLTRPPDRSFARRAFLWVSGEELARVLADKAMTAGDFVRNVKQLTDLLRQLGEVAPDRHTSRAAREAARAAFRGVVAAWTPPSLEGPDGSGRIPAPGRDEP